MKIRYLIFGALMCSLPVMAQGALLDYGNEEDLKPAMDDLWADGIIHGYPDGTYKLKNSINRAEFTKMVISALDKKGDKMNCFSDVKDEWFAPYVCSAAEMGIIDGYPDGSFKPAQNVNFVEASKILANAFELDSECSDCNKEWFERFVKALDKRNAVPHAINSFEQTMTRGELFEMMWRVKYDAQYRPYTTYDLISSTDRGGYLNDDSSVLVIDTVSPSVGVAVRDGKVVLKTHKGEVKVVGADGASFEYLDALYNNVLVFRDNTQLYVLHDGNLSFNKDISPEGWKKENIYDDFYLLLRPYDGLTSGDHTEMERMDYDLTTRSLYTSTGYYALESQTIWGRLFGGVEDNAQLRKQQEEAGLPNADDVEVLVSGYVMDQNGIYQVLADGGYYRLARFTGVPEEVYAYDDRYQVIKDAESVFVLRSTDEGYVFSKLEKAAPDSFEVVYTGDYTSLTAFDSNAMYLIHGATVLRTEGRTEENTRLYDSYVSGVVFVTETEVNLFQDGVVTKLEGADPETFTYDWVNDYFWFFRDKDSLWLFNEEKKEIYSVDVKGAKFVANYVYVLDGKVYYISYYGDRLKIKALADVDGDTFEVIPDKSDYLFKDQNSVFMTKLNNGFDDGEGWTIKKIEGLNPQKLQIIDTGLITERYSGWPKGIEMIGDDDSLVIVYSWWNSIWPYAFEVEEITDMSNFKVYVNPAVEKQRGQPLEKGWSDADMVFFTDGKSVWVADQQRSEVHHALIKLGGADPATFDPQTYLDSRGSTPVYEEIYTPNEYAY